MVRFNGLKVELALIHQHVGLDLLALLFIQSALTTVDELLDFGALGLEVSGLDNLLPGAVGLYRMMLDRLDEVIKVFLEEHETLLVKKRKHHVDEHKVLKVDFAGLSKR